jgi:two-component system sensor histidine kinase HydH
MPSARGERAGRAHPAFAQCLRHPEGTLLRGRAAFAQTAFCEQTRSCAHFLAGSSLLHQMGETIFAELKRYVGFDTGDAAALRALLPVAEPHFERISILFYDRILAHEGARKALEGGESQVGHLRHTLVGWMTELFRGPWDEAYYEVRARIGRKHVAIALPQHYMFGAMNVLRQELNAVVDEAYLHDPEELRKARIAVGKILDLELAIMLHTYREDLLSQQARVERLSTFGQLVGSIGHELRNPLGVMESSLYILKGRIGEDARAQKHVERIGEQLGIANSIIKDLLDMIRDRPLAAQRLRLRDVVEMAGNQLHLSLGLESLADLPEIDGDPNQLRQVFVNLLDNASHAAGEAGWVHVEGELENAQVAVGIEDSGKGVDEATRRRLFEPLVTTKQKGIGLGLALVKRIVERHRGTISYEPRGNGARFVVRLPKAEANASVSDR